MWLLYDLVGGSIKGEQYFVVIGNIVSVGKRERRKEGVEWFHLMSDASKKGRDQEGRDNNAVIRV